MARILIVEDEQAINNLIKLNLELVGHTCVQEYDGTRAVERLVRESFDLAILDVMLPGLSGFEVLEELWAEDRVPAIFVTAKGGLEDRLKGLKLGADDYIVKPFEILELVARVEAVLRRSRKVSDTFHFGDIQVDFRGKKVYKQGREVSLKPKEFLLLEAFICNRNLALSRDRLIELVWDYDFDGDSRTVDVHVQQLRQKLGLKDRLKTVYKTGYRLEI